VANAGRLSNLRMERWAHVMEAVGLGRHSAIELCVDAGFDPDEIVGNLVEEDEDEG